MYFFKIFLVVTSVWWQTKPLIEEKFEINKKASQLQWMGREISGGPIEGTIGLESGSLTMENGKIKGGKFVMNMNSISRGRDKDGVEEHLKSDDFFSVKKFPYSYFTVTRITQSTKPNEAIVTGNLTIKGVTNAVLFPVSVSLENGQLKTKGAVSFNRTLWGITYKSMSFLAAVSSGLIENEIRIKFDLVFDKAN